MRRVLLTLAFLALSCSVLGQDTASARPNPPVSGRSSASVGVSERSDGPTPLMALAPGGQYVLTLPPSAVVTLSPGRIVVDLNGPGPQPPTPTPTPTPTPVPPPPTPTPNPVPTPQAKISRVIVVYDPLAVLTAGQTAIGISSEVRRFLNDACDKSADGRPAYRFWTTDIDVADESADWREAWDKVKGDVATGGLPKVYVFDSAGKVRQTPLPNTPLEFVAKLKSINGG